METQVFGLHELPIVVARYFLRARRRIQKKGIGPSFSMLINDVLEKCMSRKI